MHCYSSGIFIFLFFNFQVTLQQFLCCLFHYQLAVCFCRQCSLYGNSTALPGLLHCASSLQENSLIAEGKETWCWPLWWLILIAWYGYTSGASSGTSDPCCQACYFVSEWSHQLFLKQLIFIFCIVSQFLYSLNKCQISAAVFLNYFFFFYAIFNFMHLIKYVRNLSAVWERTWINSI